MAPEPVVATEVRVLEGPNLYFTKPAVKVVLALPGYAGLSAEDCAALGRAIGLRSTRPGKAETSLRQRWLMRLSAYVARRLCTEVGVRRISVRVRPGATEPEVVLALPWRHRTRGLRVGEELAPLLCALADLPEPSPEAADEAFAAAAARVGDELGPAPSVRRPRAPVVSITGTNGKTTTTRMVAHMAMTAGLTTAWSSTDGVFAMGECVESGDFSGPAGARAVLATEGLDIGILETARGGMLLKGMGVAQNDVSVVTNVTADHLGLQGIDTLDQLAEVKAIVTTVTKPDGWVVLNGEDPRVWAMRHRVRAHTWAFAVDPSAPALRESLESGGRGMTVLDGWVVVLRADADPERLVKVQDVPVTLSGLSTVNTANALGAAAAALALGIPRDAVLEGLRTFTPDPVLNAGRLNTYSVPLPATDGESSARGAAGTAGTATVIIDLAHNEAGLEMLLQVCHGLTAPGARTHLAVGGTGDRAAEAIVAMGEIAGKGADHIVIADKPHYARSRTVDEVADLLREGLRRSGIGAVDHYGREVEALAALVGTAAPGDVIAIMCHDERAAVAEWLAEHGALVDGPHQIRRKVVAHRGEHELESEITEARGLADSAARVQALRRLVEGHRGDARLGFELGTALLDVGELVEAVEHFEAALAASGGGALPEPHLHHARIRLASALRSLGRPAEALPLLDEVLDAHPDSVAAHGFRALTLRDLGRSEQALSDLLRVLAETTTDADSVGYRDALVGYAVAGR